MKRQTVRGFFMQRFGRRKYKTVNELTVIYPEPTIHTWLDGVAGWGGSSAVAVRTYRNGHL